MALATPYPLDFLCEVLRDNGVTFDLLRNDEMSGSGSGQFWAAELAPPVWQVSLSLAARRPERAREVDAKIRALGVGRGTMLFADPTYSPAAGGAPGNAVVVASIDADRTRIGLSGLPAGYVVTAGDRLSIAISGGQYFAEFAEGGTASGAGVLGLTAVHPYLPLNLNTGAAVNLSAPVLRCMIPSGGHAPFWVAPGRIASGASLTLLQKV